MNRHHNVCILGGSGFIGQQIAARLVSAGRTVTVVTRRVRGGGPLSVLPTVRLVDADVHDEEALAAVLEGNDAVINLIGILNESRRANFRTVHVELPRKVAQACRRVGIRRLLHMSSLRADAGNAPSRYLRSKGEGEAALRVHSGKDVAFTIFQPSVVFGPGDSFINRFADLLRVMPIAFPLACPYARFQPVAVDDVAAAFLRALDEPATSGQRYTLCGPRVYTLRELVCLIRDELELRRWVVGLPDPLARLQGAVMQWLPGAPFSLDNFHSMQVDSVCADGESGLRSLGISPTPLALALPTILHGRR